ncbi:MULTISPECIES: MarR family winged helix-turn-helix transcriptional regulator [unclassified Saccharicrinis]|uniref:MarR family winged helix-turn-helix transcriptional regulator n=1 Tax=unclassified Saccharicrinis TaxID=2646859 RepID=UPI003D340DF8
MEDEKDIIDILIADWKKERPELDVEAMHIVGRILKLNKILEKRTNKVLKDSAIHYTDLDVLATLRRSGEPFLLAPKQLMKSVLITSGAMTALLDRLTKLELVYRAPDLKDGRIKLVGLTEKGREKIDQAIVVRFEESKSAVQGLDKNECSELSILLKKLLKTIS